MTIEKAIETYKRSQHLPKECDINWIKENFNPILKTLNKRMSISWACNTCFKNYMNMLIGWYDKNNPTVISLNAKEDN